MIRSREVGLFNAYALSLAGTVTVCFWVCFLSVHLLGVRELMQNFEPYIAYNLISVGGLLLQLYQTDSNRVNVLSLDGFQNFRISVSQTLYVGAALTVMLVLTKDMAISRLFLLIYLFALLAALFLANARIPRILSGIFFSGSNQIPALLVGRIERVGRMRHWLRRMENYGVAVIGLLVEDATPRTKTIHRIPIVGTARDLKVILNKIRVETVILMDMPLEQSVLDGIVDATDGAGVRMIVLNNLGEAFKHSLQFYRQFGVDFIALRPEPLQDPMNRAFKRALDIAVALVVVAFILPPLALLVRWAHRKESPGPLFFRQTRAGIQNRRFEIVKFRTMHFSTADSGRQASEEDERVFRWGRFLRKTSIDEIPQFLNVLRGEMSVVGPRPHMLEHNEKFASVLAAYHVRTFVKPGVTGLAQVQGLRGEARTSLDIQRRVACDIDYIEHWSLLFDLSLILQTAFQVLRPPKSAY